MIGFLRLSEELVRQHMAPDQGRAVVLEALSYAIKVEVDVVVKPRDMPTLGPARLAERTQLPYRQRKEHMEKRFGPADTGLWKTMSESTTKMTTLELVKSLLDDTYDVEAYHLNVHRWCVGVKAWPEHTDDLTQKGGEIMPQTEADQPAGLVLAIWPSHAWPMDGAALLKELDDE